MEVQLKAFLCSYKDNFGRTFGFTLYAVDHDDAEDMLECIRENGTVDGELTAEIDQKTGDVSMPDYVASAPLPKGKWCSCGLPHETGGPCWECRADLKTV